jgi:hypothetical protein
MLDSWTPVVANCAENRPLIGTDNGCRILLSSLRAHLTNADRAKQGCMCLFNLSTGAIAAVQSSLASAGVANDVKLMLELHVSDASVVEEASALVCNLVANHSQNR